MEMSSEITYKLSSGSQHSYYEVYSDETEELLATVHSQKELKEFNTDVTICSKIEYLDENLIKLQTKNHIKYLIESTGADTVKLFFSSSTNIRDSIATIQDYKGNRKGGEKPKYYQFIKDYIKRNYDTETVDGLEADDLLGIYSRELDPNFELKAVVVSQDKDQLTVPGFFYNLGTEKHLSYSKDIGSIFFIDPIEANRNFYKQLLQGDSTDNIPGLFRVTGSKCRQLYLDEIDKLDTEESMLEYVINIYSKALGNKDTEYIDLKCLLWELGNLLYIRSSFKELYWNKVLSI